MSEADNEFVENELNFDEEHDGPVLIITVLYQNCLNYFYRLRMYQLMRMMPQKKRAREIKILLGSPLRNIVNCFSNLILL